jgi:hypothetical protein
MGRSLLDSAVYDPDTLKLLRQAFDEAWLEIAGNYGAAAMAEDRRKRLALFVLGLADNGERDAVNIKNIALRLMKSVEQPFNGRR